ncbi:MAG: hypothetical protein LBH46_01840 [Rickettsiales bacterium]|jgi:hypothetical protein|nr:hypothetical protein [Rickettsiales bacterium]
MAVTYQRLKDELVVPYIKYWIVFIVLILALIIRIYRVENINVNNITLDIPNAEYVGNGVVINNFYLLTSKSLIENSCWGRSHFKQGSFYAIDSKFMYPIVPAYSNDNMDIIAMRIKTIGSMFDNYAVFDMEDVKYNMNRRVVLPKQRNRVSSFDFRQARIVADIEREFLVASRSVLNEQFAVGMPVFHRNYVLQGIIKERVNTFKELSMRDKMLNFLGNQKIFYASKSRDIKNFLMLNDIEFFETDTSASVLDNITTDVTKSVLNIICVNNGLRK